ncbi:MAG: TlpA family protein disulfide reductase, partial [Candidatus Zixiibacteriota bacterium]
MKHTQTQERSKSILPILVVSLVGLSLASCGSSSSARKTETKAPSKPVFDAVAYTGPRFSLPSVDGKIVNFTDLMGKGPVALNFWGTWCAPCRREMPEFKRIWAEYEEKGVQIMGVALRDTRERVALYTTQQGITWPQVIGTQRTAIDYGYITGVPT